jgi:mono/diheme cytochrome c family protein
MRHVAVTLIASVLLCAAQFVQACAADASPSADKPEAAVLADAGGALGDAALSDAAAALCTVQAPTSCPTPKPHYADVEPIFKQRCVGCHNGASPDSQWPLTEYEHVADWFDIIRDEMLHCSMPPADSGITMPNAERSAILTWIRCGFPK